MAIRVIVNGAQGKMGRLACETLQEHSQFELVGCLTRQDNLRQAIEAQQAQVVLDLTSAASVYANSMTIIECGAHPVIGTTGLLEEQVATLKSHCEEIKLGGLIVPNFSISAALMMRFAAIAARFLPRVEIIEAHHPAKVDAPSGTAIKTAAIIAAAKNEVANKIGNAGENSSAKSTLKNELIGGVRGGTYLDIPIHSLRLPGILAKQEIIFGANGETLTISENIIDRSAFMPGMVLACQKVMELKSLYYGLDYLLELA